MSISASSLQIPTLLSPPPPTKTLARVWHLRPNLTLARARARIGFGLNQAAEAAPNSQILGASSPSRIATASDVVRDFYASINRRDLAAVERLIAEGCVYEDLVFSHPFVGRKAILDFFKKFTESISEDLQFVIDDISNEDTLAVGVTWHLEWKGRPFPFSKGCSVYRLEVSNGVRQIIFGRDCVEPATKPGEVALVLIRGVTWILQKFPQLAERL